MSATPAEAIMEAGIVAVNCVALTKILPTWFDVRKTSEFEVKPDPLMVSVNAALPAGVEAGLRLEIAGIGGVMVKVDGADVPPSVVTVMLAMPAVATRLAGIAATSVLPVWVMTNGVDPQLTVAVEVK